MPLWLVSMASNSIVQMDACPTNSCKMSLTSGQTSGAVVEITKALIAAVGKELVSVRLSPFTSFHSRGAKKKNPVPQFTHVMKELKALDIAFLDVIEPQVTDGPTDGVYAESGSLDFAVEAWGKEKPVVIAVGLQLRRRRRSRKSGMQTTRLLLRLGDTSSRPQIYRSECIAGLSSIRTIVLRFMLQDQRGTSITRSAPSLSRSSWGLQRYKGIYFIRILHSCGL